MTEGGENKLRRFFGLAARAFILASLAAVILPMPLYVRSLSNAQYIVWMARLSWVLLLTVGVVAVLLLVGFITSQQQKKTRKTR